MQLTIPHRYCGPPESGNGGWVSGALAGHVPTTARMPAVTVRLSSPPPLDRALTLSASPTDDGLLEVRMLDDASRGHLVASATASGALVEEIPAAATTDGADAAERRYEGLLDHPFPTCFVCGTGREPGDALCLRPGPLDDGSGRYAATWVPAESTGALVWAALDCPGGWAAGIAGRPMVLGTMTAVVTDLPSAGEPHVVTAWQRGSQGRAHHSGTALHTAGGACWPVPRPRGSPSTPRASDRWRRRDRDALTEATERRQGCRRGVRVGGGAGSTTPRRRGRRHPPW